VATGQSEAQVGERCGCAVRDRLRNRLFCQSSSSRAVITPSGRSSQTCRSSCNGYPLGAFGYSHLPGVYAGGQAEYVRCLTADVGPIVIPDGSQREGVIPVLHPTSRWMAGERDIEPVECGGLWGLRTGRVCSLFIRPVWRAPVMPTIIIRVDWSWRNHWARGHRLS